MQPSKFTSFLFWHLYLAGLLRSLPFCGPPAPNLVKLGVPVTHAQAGGVTGCGPCPWLEMGGLLQSGLTQPCVLSVFPREDLQGVCASVHMRMSVSISLINQRSPLLPLGLLFSARNLSGEMRVWIWAKYHPYSYLN